MLLVPSVMLCYIGSVLRDRQFDEVESNLAYLGELQTEGDRILKGKESVIHSHTEGNLIK